MGRKRLWSPEHYAAWRELRGRAEFIALERLVSLGLRKVDLPDLDPLIAVSPRLPAGRPLSDVKHAIEDTVNDIGDGPRSAALLALLRATEEAENLPLDAAQRLARVKLGEGDGHIPRLRAELERLPTSLELIDLISRDNGHFRRAPKADRKPGEYFLLLRDLYRELIPASRNGGDNIRQVKNSSGRVGGGKAAAHARGTSELTAVRNALKSHFRTELELTQLARVLLTDQETIEHLAMDVTLTDHDADWFQFRVVREFHARFSDYTVAVVLGDEARAAVMRCIPELKDIIWLPSETPSIDVVVDEMVKGGLLALRDRRSQSGFKPAKFKRLNARHEFVRRIKDDAVTNPESYRLLALEIPGGGRELVHFRSSLHMPLLRARRRCAWFADGPTFIDRISVDLSGFSDAVASEDANVYFMLPGTRNYSTADELRSKCFDRTVNDWVVRHHGFFIHW
jgi:hypothetical protein